MNGSELWGNIVSGAIAGIVAAVFLPAALFLLNWIRNRRLERKIREGFGLCGAGRGETFHLFVENHLPIEVRIRAVVLVGGQNGSWHLHLNYLQPGPHTALLNAISRQEHPTRIFAGAHFPDAVNPTVAVSLPGFSGGTWGVPLEEIRKRPWVIEERLDDS
jgi:hypothetical protein